MGLFKKKRPKAAVFVDYEHWYISMRTKYDQQPNIKSWVDDLHKRVDIEEIVFFGDFTKYNMESEIQRIRLFTSKIVETKNASGHYKKDFTDFIMLDYIYQKAFTSSSFDTVILFTGDGHFTSVCAFMRNCCKKQVGIYAVRDCFSKQLRDVADWYMEIPSEEDLIRPYYHMILEAIMSFETSEGKKLYPTYMRVVNQVIEQYGVTEETVRDAMDKLMAQGYIRKEEKSVGFRKHITALITDWKALVEADIWDAASRATFKQKNTKK
ncbi:MAG: NYN domain-containing protein [Clostridia bacterium]|nr:NYN domain-containing protein [Clostridia bacterium]